MPTTVNEAAPATPSALPGPENSVDAAAHAARRTDAVGAEIAVTIHASRYSSNRGTTNKNLPPVHEETRTVIIFPTGAVVRLSASVTTGELVVLTNQQTGDDVICRVANVKAQTGTQNYVNLEFTQRAPSFWGDAIQSSRANRPDSPKLAVQPAVIPQMAPPENIRVQQPEPVAVAEPAKRQPLSVPSAELLSAVQAVTALLNSAPRPLRAAGRAEGAAAQLPTVFEEEGSEHEASEREDSEPLFDEQAEEEVLFSADHKPEMTAAPGAMPATVLPKITVATDLAPQLQPQAQLQVVPPLVVKAPDVIPSLPAPILMTADLKIADLKTKSTLESASRAVTKVTPDSNAKAERLLGVGTIGDSRDNAKVGTSFGLAGDLSFSKAMQKDAQEWSKASPLPSQLDEKPSNSKKILLIAAAAVVLLSLGGVGGAVLFRQSRPVPEQPPAAATAPATTPSVMGGTVVTAAATSPVMAQPASSSMRTASADGDAGNQPAKVNPPAESSTARPSIRVGKLAAPVTRAATSVVSSEPPPDLVAPAAMGSLVDNNFLASASRSNEPMAPVAGASHVGGQLQQPKLISAPPASYPPQALRAKMQGVVVIDALVDTNGKVTALKVLSGLTALQQAAMEAVHNWRYEPARLNGQPIAVHTKVNVTFQLQ
jgi:TonB family protein